MKKLITILTILALLVGIECVFGQPIIPGGTWFFKFLHDTPNTYTSQAGKILQVNAEVTAIEFTSLDDIEIAMGIDLVENTALSTWINTFAKLNTVVADKTLVNEEDAVTWDSTHTFAGNSIVFDKGAADSPILAFKDGDDKMLYIRKDDDGWARLYNNEGAIYLQPSNDTDDYLSISTASGIVTITTIANDDGDLVITAGGGEIGFGDENLSTTGTVQGVTQAEFDTLTDNSIANTLHRHTELVASDGSPDPALSVDSVGRVGMGTVSPGGTLHIKSGASVVRIEDTGATATATTSYIEFGGTTASNWDRTGYIGDSVSGDTHIRLCAEDSDLILGDSSSTSVLTLSGGDVTATGALEGATLTEGGNAVWNATETDIIDSGHYIAASIDYEHLAADVISGAAAVGTFESGDTFLVLEAGVGLREVDYDDLPGAAGVTAWDDIGDPDNSGLTTITFDNAELSLLTGDNDAAASFITIQNSDADHTGGNLYLLDLDYSGDDGDVDADFIKLQDSGSVLMTIQEEGKIVMTPGGVGSLDAISVTPSAALSTNEASWNAFKIDGTALDPSGDDILLCGVNVDMSGVVFGGTGGDIDGIGINMASGEDHAIHISQGKFVAENTVAATAGAEFTIFDIQIHTASMNANSSIHAIDVATPETPAGTVVAVGTHSNIEVIQQSIGTFSTPSQTEYAGEKHTGGTVWADGVDTSEIFVVDDDEVYVGSTAQFSEIDVIMATPSSKTVTPTFHYNTAPDTWTEFFPADDTDGFQQSGIIRWTLADISGSWTNDGDPGGADSSTGYWIKIIRTANADPGTPTPTTVKTGAITLYSWSKTGAVDVLSMEADTITEGGVAVHNNDQMDASSELATIIDDETGSGLIVFSTSPTFTTTMTLDRSHDTPATAPFFSFTRDRDGAPTRNVSNGDYLGQVRFQGYHTDEYNIAARIVAIIDNTPGDDDMPTRLEFQTAKDAAASPTVRMTIDSAGDIELGGDDNKVDLTIHHAGVLTLYDASDDTSVTMVVADGTDNLTFTGDLDVSGAISGDGSALTVIDAATGDSATAFFDAGTIEHEWGGLQANLAAYTGLIGITGADTTVEVDLLSELLTAMGDVTAFITDDDMPAAAADPDVDAAGEIGRDTDGANETGDSSLRGYDGAAQFLYSKKLKTLNFTLIEPDQIDAYDLIPVWHNTSGMTFTIVEWKAWSDDDNVSFEIEELTDQTDYTARTQVDACEIATDGTGVFYGSDATITHAAIEHDHSLAIDFDCATDTPDYVQICIVGWFNADVN